jgi:hypothetical protein
MLCDLHLICLLLGLVGMHVGMAVLTYALPDDRRSCTLLGWICLAIITPVYIQVVKEHITETAARLDEERARLRRMALRVQWRRERWKECAAGA